MRYHMRLDGDHVDHLIARCLRSKDEARRIFEALAKTKQRHVDLFTGRIRLSDTEYSEFMTRFSSEVEPTVWESSFRKH
mgnify:CR=1 FL=1